MKKSLSAAMEAAQEQSRMYPSYIVWVLDKPGHRAVYTVLDWIYRERIMEGYATVARFKNGERVKQ